MRVFVWAARETEFFRVKAGECGVKTVSKITYK